MLNPVVDLPRRALVTGGSGFIGHHLVCELVREGVQVRVLLAPGDSAPNLAGVAVERAVGDVCDRRAMEDAAMGCDVVFHLAAIYALWLPEPAKMYRVNVEGSLNAVHAAAVAGGRLVLTSSIAAIGLEDGRPADENTQFNRWTEANDYVLSKYVAELEALRLSRSLGVEMTIVNPSLPLGPGDIGPTPTGASVKMIVEGRFPAWFGGGANVVDVRDVAHGHWLAAQRGRPYERYILGGHNVQMRELSTKVAELAGVHPPRFRAPRKALLALGAAAEVVAERLTRRAPPFTEKSMAYVVERDMYFDIGKAQSELGYAIRPLQETLAASIAWFRSEAFAATRRAAPTPPPRTQRGAPAGSP